MELVTIYCTTFNTHGYHPRKDKPYLCNFTETLHNWIPPKLYDIYYFAFQEVVPLTIKTLLKLNETESHPWISTISSVLGTDYCLLIEERMVGCSSIIYIKKSLRSIISISIAYRLPYDGRMNLGNKGSIILKCKIADTPITFINSHYVSGKDNSSLKRRNKQYKYCNDLLSLGGNKHIISVGCFNYTHEDNDNNNQGYPKGYQEHLDQLSIEKIKGTIFNDYSELPIKFSPTSKYSLGKLRSASYPDRILWKTSGELECLSYYSINEIYCSDHKPVCSIFQISF